jgi:hypothetical protein
VKRLWGRSGVLKIASVGLLVAGTVGGVYLGQNRDDQERSVQAQLVAQQNLDDMSLIREREAQHAAARAYQREAGGEAADKAATEAKAAASKAHTAQAKVISDKKAADEKAAKEKAEKEAEESGSATGGGTHYAGEIPASCSEFSGNRKIGCAMMLEAGFGIDQFPCLNKLWDKESGWNERAKNPSSGAYGIPQAYPGKKMSSSGSDWQSNAATQIDWGLGYIKGRYSTPCGAWNTSENTGSY